MTLLEIGEEVSRVLEVRFSWRAVFDCYAGEWEMLSPAHRQAIVQYLASMQLLRPAVYMYKRAYCHRPDIVQAVHESLMRAFEGVT